MLLSRSRADPHVADPSRPAQFRHPSRRTSPSARPSPPRNPCKRALTTTFSASYVLSRLSRPRAHPIRQDPEDTDASHRALAYTKARLAHAGDLVVLFSVLEHSLYFPLEDWGAPGFTSYVLALDSLWGPTDGDAPAGRTPKSRTRTQKRRSRSSFRMLSLLA